MRRETWYVMEDGSCANPRDISRDQNGKFVHRDGRKVAYAPHGPRTRGVDVGEEGKDMRPQQTGLGYLTRDVQHPLDHDGDGNPGGSLKPADAGDDIAAVRAEYYAAFGKRPFAGWDVAALRAKLAERAAGDVVPESETE